MPSGNKALPSNYIKPIDLVMAINLPDFSPTDARNVACVLVGLSGLLIAYIAAIATNWIAVPILLLSTSVVAWRTTKTINVRGFAWTLFIVSVRTKMWFTSARVERTSEPYSPSLCDPANEISSGSWVCLKEKYQQSARKASKTGYSSGQRLKPDYMFVVATHPYSADRGKRVVAFSDGTREIWGNRSLVIMSQRNELAPSRENAPDTTAIASWIPRILDTLSERSEPMLVTDLVGLGQGEELLCNRALQITYGWGLITVKKSESAHADDEYGGREAIITRAGHAWSEASKPPDPIQSGKRRKVAMLRDNPGSISIGDISGSSVYVGVQFDAPHNSFVQNVSQPDRELLSCIAELLAAHQIPWEAPELADEKAILEEAVSRSTTNSDRLKNVLAKIANTFGPVLVRVISDGSYKLLMQHMPK